MISCAGFYFFFISSLFFFSGFKKKRKIYFGGREGEGESHKAKMFINFFIKKVYYLKNLKTRPLDRKILVTRILDWVLGFLISNVDFIVLVIVFFSLGFMKSIHLGGRGKCGGTMKVEKSVKITK